MADCEKSNGEHDGDGPHRCPICKKQIDAAAQSYPFCSERCRTIDLGRWADEKYLISRPIEYSDLDEE